MSGLNTVLGQDIKDPFSGSIDEFLTEKQTKSTQDTFENKLEDATDKPNVDIVTKTPDDMIEDKSDDILDDKPTLEESKVDETSTHEKIEEKSEKLEDETKVDTLDAMETQIKELEEKINKIESKEEKEEKEDKAIEASLNKIGIEISNRGYPIIASTFFKIAKGVKIENTRKSK